MKLKTVSFVVLLFAALQFSFAQEKTIAGTVKDETGMPLPGIVVTIKGTNRGVSTDFDGNYSISAKPNDVLQFMGMGLKLVSKVVSNSTTRIDVVMEEQTEELDEVVITGYTTRKKDVTTSGVTTVGSENLGKLTPSTSVDNMLQGKAVGVDVTSLNGKPGQTATIKVRGAVSLNAKGGDKAQPLYVVDGVFVSESDLNILNPNDVETMTVLKDAASTAIYGSRGANGVIVITTKQGKKGGAKISYSARTGFGEKIEDPFEMMNAEEKMRYEEAYNATTYTRTDAQKSLLASYDHDWQKDILRNSQIVSHSLSASGATDNGSYFLSGGFDKNTGIVRKVEGFKRYTVRFNFDTKVTDKLKIGLNSSVAHTRSDELRDRNNVQNPFRAMYLYNAYEPVYARDADGAILYDSEGKAIYNETNQGFNILEGIETAPSLDKRTQLVGSLYAKYEIIKGLSFLTKYSANYRRFIRENYTMPGSILDGYVGDPAAPGSKNDRGRDTYVYTWLNQLSYQKSFGDHNLNATVFSEYTDDYFYYYFFESKGYSNRLLTTQENSSAPVETTTSKEESALFSLAGLVEYDYKGKYLASASLRRDGASRFGADHRYGLFWSGSLGWNISKEDFLSSVEWLNNLKLTASYGTTGNWNIPNYASQGYYGSVSYGGQPAARPNLIISNKDLTWEEQVSYNFGLESDFFNNRISFTASYFNNARKDFLFERSLAYETGAYTQYTNTGKMVSSGFELSLSADVIKTEDFRWNVGGNITFMDYTIKDLGGQNDIVVGGISVLREGETPFTFYMPRYAGVDPNNGDALYYHEDETTKAITTTNDFSLATNFVHRGKSVLPKQYGGFYTSFKYKGVDLSADFSFKLGQYTHNYMAQHLLSDGASISSNKRRDALDYWKQVGDNKLPRLDSKFNQTTDRFLQDASYIRFRTLSLGYTLPKGTIKGFSDVRIFVQGQNLYTWTKFEGDPEVSIGSGENQLGATQNFIPGLYYLYSYPTTRTYTMGIDVTF